MERFPSFAVCLLVLLLTECSTLRQAPARRIVGKPFSAVWNAPSEHCLEKFGVDLNLTAYDIAAGPESSVIFYNEEMGLYPFVKNGVIYNGGVPQVVNLTSHLEKATSDIIRNIPDVDFSGIAVIDWEYWQPVWDADQHSSHHPNVYKTISISLVQNRHPDWDHALVKKVAILEFEQSAESLFESTIMLARKLRPNALWGFYHFPYCFYMHTTESCAQYGIRASNQMHWLYDEVASLYPSIYLKLNVSDSKVNQVPFVEAVIGEAFRVRNNSRNHSTPMFSYCRYNYPKTDLFLNLEHLRETILLSAEMGVSGVVLWSSLNDTSTKEDCQELQRYIGSALGPLVKTTVDGASHCSQSLCNGNGRCVGKILTCTQTAPSPGHKGNDKKRAPSEPLGRTKLEAAIPEPAVLSHLDRSASWDTVAKCTCQCYDGWTGEKCNIKK